MWRMLLLGLLALGGVLQAAEEVYRLDEYLQAGPNQVSSVKAGKPTLLEKKLTLANGFIVHTNGTLELSGGVEKKLKPGQQLTFDGLLMALDGRFLLIRDHYLVDAGRVTLVKDGQSSAVSGGVAFADGTRISADGWLVRPNGKRTRLLDGHTLDLNGKPLAAQDFVMNKGGKIVLQKEGGLVMLDGSRHLAMSDGTRVYANGRVVRQNGSERMLQPGQRLNLPGIVLP